MSENKNRKNKKYPGVFSVKGKLATSYGIDYIHPQIGWNPGERGNATIFRPREAWGLPTILKDDGKPFKDRKK